MRNHYPQWREMHTYPQIAGLYVCLICKETRKRVYHCEKLGCELWVCRDHMKNEDPHFVRIQITGVEL